ncbi:hypothetical protein Hypma_006246 [Hypsizygus marmoreus]|uniref:F-box domain-containing protein n=1 Tax=Hypsizygus marmoreus TaxID=39966 RepID=A0A369JTL7_HYPMA|nr:hypothetical protein Hypma_006246 [Hypsizygus marmoreus]
MEILQEIFFHSMMEVLMPEIHARARPLIFSHVCGHWRQVVLSTPALWARVVVQIQFRYRPSYTSIVNLWLERSHSFPLDLYLLDSRCTISRLNPDPVLELLLAHAHRWHTISWCLQDGDSAEQFLENSIGAGHENLLESLDISILRCKGDQSERFPLALQPFSHLRRLSYSSNTSQCLLNLPFTHLTHLKLQCPIPVDVCGRILSQCLTVVNVSIRDIIAPLDEICRTHLFLPELRSLDLYSSWGDLGLLLGQLNCPNLHILGLRCGGSQHSHVKAYETFLLRSGCHLLKFTFYDNWLPEGYLVRLLAISCLKSLQNLEVACYNLSDCTINLLTQREVLPRLKRLEIWYCCSSDGKLADMIASRWRKRPSSPRYTLTWCSLGLNFSVPPGKRLYHCDDEEEQKAILSAHKKDMKRFRSFTADGLELHWNLNTH